MDRIEVDRIEMDRIEVGRRKFNGPIRTGVAKPGRNQPCPCGSGRKYKKCCMEERNRIMSTQEVDGAGKVSGYETVPSNDFRKELEAENVSQAELMLRDQIVMARAMESNHRQAKFMREMLEASLDELSSTHEFMQAQPHSEGKPEILAAILLQIDQLQERLVTPIVSRADAVQLAALKAAIDATGLHPDAHVVDQAPAPDVKAPIANDGLPGEDEDSDDDELEEEHEMVDPNSRSVKVE